ncbi:MAG: ABC transporter ATP-binding protein [Candidatus Thorarchaeota archaeon]|nr:ABC transporter ATP-binding protein [Candidatus Thorarchaeota archaeon]
MASNDNGISKTKSPSRYMLGGLIRHPLSITLATILTVVSILLVTIPTVIVGLAVDELEVGGLSTQFVNYVWLIVGLGLLYMAMYFVVGYIWAVVTLSWERDARQDFFEDLQDYSMTFHDEVDSKRLLSVAMQDISWVRFSLNPALRNILGGFASIIITGVLLSIIDQTPGLIVLFVIPFINVPVGIFTSIILVGTPIYLLYAYKYANAVEPVRRQRSEVMENLTSRTQGVFQGIEVVRAFGKEEHEQAKFGEVSKQYEKRVAREGQLAAFYLPALILTAMTTIAFFYGGYSVWTGIITKGTLIQILGLLVALEMLNFQLPHMLLMMRGGFVNAQRIVDILSWKEPMIEPEEEVAEINWLGDIEFNHISFKYNTTNGNNDHYALKDLNIKIPGGYRVALIGGPGGGKSTVLKMLLRLYDPTEGEVRIGDVNLRDVRTSTVRDNVGLVEQDIFLFRMTVHDNIAFGRPDATREQVEEAAKRAQAHEFIVELEDGYDAMIGERGMTLSGGQRQRLAIARALIQDPKILLLDDSVSAVDAQTEFLMRKALDEVMVGRTSITVTQRLRTLIESDLVIMLDKGRLIDAGCHDDLLRESELYRRIFERLPGAKALLAGVAIKGGAQ